MRNKKTAGMGAGAKEPTKEMNPMRSELSFNEQPANKLKSKRPPRSSSDSLSKMDAQLQTAKRRKSALEQEGSM